MIARTHAQIARQAMEAVGGADRLVRYLGTSPEELRSWLTGNEIPRASVFFILLDIATQTAHSEAQDGLR